MIFNKVCELEDFRQGELQQTMLKWFGERFSSVQGWPEGSEDRKVWEICMTLLACETLVPESSRNMALGVGAGIEATSFALTNIFRWVFAIDRYGAKQWASDAPGGMLVQPAAYASSVACNPKRLVVQHMDARELRFDDASFDFIYSSSSIEHFGTLAEIRQAVREMGRVLKPEGIMSFSTELRIGGESQWLNESTYLFSAEDLLAILVESSGCEMVGEYSFVPSPITKRKTTRNEDAVRDVSRCRDRLDVKWSTYPHVVLELGELAWTSVQLTLRKLA